MEHFAPRLAGQTALGAPGWKPGEATRRNGIFGERAIGELVSAIVARLGQEIPGFVERGS